MANKDFKLLAEAYDQVVRNNFDIGTENTPPGGVKMEKLKSEEFEPHYNKPEVLKLVDALKNNSDVFDSVLAKLHPLPPEKLAALYIGTLLDMGLITIIQK